MERVRDIDIVGWLNSDCLCLILPYTSFEGAKQVIEYICESLNSSIAKSAYSLHTYPFEGILSDQTV